MWRWRTFVVSGVGRTSSGINVDGRAIAHHCINLFNLPITDRNTSGLTVKAVRYYSDIGIIKPNVAVDTGYRDFSEPDLAKLQFVAKARKFDFSSDPAANRESYFCAV